MNPIPSIPELRVSPVDARGAIAKAIPPHQGWLMKKGGVRKNWKRRLFILEDGVMKYFAVDKSKQKELKGSFSVKDTTCGPAAGATGRKYNSAFQILTAKRTYFMIASSPEDLALWQRALAMHGALWITTVADSSPLSMVLANEALVDLTRQREREREREKAARFVTSPRLERMDTHARELDLHTTVIDTIVLPDTLKWPVLTLHMKYVGCGGEVYLNGKMISNYEHSPIIHKHIACISEWSLFEEPANTLAAMLKYPEADYFSDCLPRLTISFMVRDLADDTWISVGHKLRLTLDPPSREPIAKVLPDEAKTRELLRINRIPSKKKARSYLWTELKFSVFGTPFPLWSWANGDVFSSAADLSQLRLEVFEATYAIYRMLVERRDAELRATFDVLLRDFAYSSLKVGKCGSEAQAMDELFKSCFLNWLEDPAYKLTHMSKKDKEYRIATSGRFVTLVTPKDDWPIVFTGRHKKPAEEPVNFVFSKINGKLVPTLFWQGPFP